MFFLSDFFKTCDLRFFEKHVMLLDTCFFSVTSIYFLLQKLDVNVEDVELLTPPNSSRSQTDPMHVQRNCFYVKTVVSSTNKIEVVHTEVSFFLEIPRFLLCWWQFSIDVALGFLKLLDLIFQIH